MPTLYKVTCPKTGDLVMIAPMNTIALVFGFAPPAVERIERETSLGQASDMHFWKRTKLGYSAINVEVVA